MIDHFLSVGRVRKIMLSNVPLPRWLEIRSDPFSRSTRSWIPVRPNPPDPGVMRWVFVSNPLPLSLIDGSECCLIELRGN